MTPSESALAYADGVLAGKILVGELTRLACQRFMNDLDRAHAGWKYIYDQEFADEAVLWMEALPHVKGEWAKRGELLQLEDWQRFIECNIWGWVHRKTGLRRFLESYEEIARKNGKSVRVAARALRFFVADDEYGAEVYTGATTERQAWEVFRPAREMCKREPDPLIDCDIEINAKSLLVMSNGSRFEPLIGKPGDGASPSFACADEFHEHASDDQVSTMQTGMASRAQPLMALITTAGHNMAGPCYERRQEVIQILQGSVEDDSVFGIIYTADENDKWDNWDAVIKANPNLGVSVSEDYLRRQLNQARRSASKQNAFRTKHLNQWVGAKVSFMNMLAWQRQKKEMSIDDFKGESCQVAVDLAAQKDASSVATMFKRGDQYYVFVEHFVPEGAFEWNEKYRDFQLGGHINVTEGNAQDYDQIRSHIDDLAGKFTIEAIRFDPWQAAQMMQELMATGLTVYKATQQFSFFSDPMKTVETAVLDGNLFHSGDPVLNWMVGNTAALKNKDDHMKPVKDNPNNPRCKIDGAVAMIMCMKGYLDVDDTPQVNIRVV